MSTKFLTVPVVLFPQEIFLDSTFKIQLLAIPGRVHGLAVNAWPGSLIGVPHFNPLILGLWNRWSTFISIFVVYYLLMISLLTPLNLIFCHVEFLFLFQLNGMWDYKNDAVQLIFFLMFILFRSPNHWREYGGSKSSGFNTMDGVWISCGSNQYIGYRRAQYTIKQN